MDCNTDEKVYNPLRKDATRKTASINTKTFTRLNWPQIDRERELAETGMLADADFIIIGGEDKSTPVWDLSKYAFLVNDGMANTVNPKLWIQGNLNLNAGLFQVTDGIYQVRGFDAGNMTFVKGDTGWIIIDCLTTKETAAAALSFAAGYFGEIPVSAVIITHSHVDHYGGIAAVIDRFANEDVKIYVPKDFVHNVIQENVTAGLAMSRRGIYQYGTILPKDAKGQRHWQGYSARHRYFHRRRSGDYQTIRKKDSRRGACGVSVSAGYRGPLGNVCLYTS